MHRAIFWLLLVQVPLLWWRTSNTGARIAAHHLLAMFLIQSALGISTLLLAVPVPLAALHQAGAVLLIAAAIWTAQASRTSTPSTANAAAATR